MLWKSKTYSTGDLTIIWSGDAYHLFTEQCPFEPGPMSIGHAVSRDLFEWEELPPAIERGPEGAFDGYALQHLDVFIHDGKWYMYYTGLERPHEPGQMPGIGLAVSDDGLNWKKYDGNPVLRADGRYYELATPRSAAYAAKNYGRCCFRDPMVVGDDATGTFGMIVVARDAHQHPDVNACLAWARSRDLVHWELEPPIYSPGRFHTIETPSIFEHDGRHYLIHLTHSNHGTPLIMTDPYQTFGNFYAISEDGWKGPYHTPPDEVVVAAHRLGTHPMRFGAGRTVLAPTGQRYLYGWINLRPNSNDTPQSLQNGHGLPPPKLVTFADDGQMRIMYDEAIERYTTVAPLPPCRVSELTCLPAEAWCDADGVVGKHFSGRTVALLPGEYDNVIFSARIRLVRGYQAGLVMRANDDATEGWRLTADRRYGRIEFGLLDEPGFIDARAWTPTDEFDLMVVADEQLLEFYVDGRLMIMQARYRETRGRIGFLVDHAEAEFSNPRLLLLK